MLIEARTKAAGASDRCICIGCDAIGDDGAIGVDTTSSGSTSKLRLLYSSGEGLYPPISCRDWSEIGVGS